MMDGNILERLRAVERRVDVLETGKSDQSQCTDTTSACESNPALVEAYALIDRYIEALQWCSGSADFGPGGQAREGWLKLCEPLLRDRTGEVSDA